ncbi:MAG TPA: hypothetical protein ENH35_04740 [Candidatus Moranbacteria bacterium]|nr:hypothetical protein [Candidatus Moranbacteria bacterium]
MSIFIKNRFARANKFRRREWIHYTHPRVAWTYAKKREYTEGRKISIRTFIRTFYKSRENVNRIKKKFGARVYVVGIRSNYRYREGIGEVKVNINNVDEIQKIEYTYCSLFARAIYVNILLQGERVLWRIKRLLKK